LYRLLLNRIEEYACRRLFRDDVLARVASQKDDVHRRQSAQEKEGEKQGLSYHQPKIHTHMFHIHTQIYIYIYIYTYEYIYMYICVYLYIARVASQKDDVHGRQSAQDKEEKRQGLSYL